MAGTAWTARTGPGGYAAVREAVATAPAGSVLVLAGEGHLGHAIWGEISTTLALGRGVVGVLVDGAVRDLAAIRDDGLAIFARGGTPRGPAAGIAGSIGIVVECGGARVAPGDLVLGDADGVVVVPADSAQEGLELARSAAERERARLAEVRASPAQQREEPRNEPG
jgi:regulator of RNase E activity RraA